MRNILVQIRGNENEANTYALDYLNCYEKPLGIALNGLFNGSSNMFYIYLKFFLSYNTIVGPINNFFDVIEMILPKIGFKLYKHQPKNAYDIHALIKSQIDEGKPVFVNGNQKEITYSLYYKEADWPHLYLIYGYDDEKEIYFIIDGTQNRKDISLYTDFVLDYKTIQKSYLSYVECYNSELIYSIEASNPLANQFALYIKMLNEAENLVNNQPFKELDIMKSYYERITELTENEILNCCEKLAQIKKNKKVMYNEMVKVIKENVGNTHIPINIKELSEKLVSSWDNVIVNYTRSLYRRKKLNIHEISCHSIITEKNIINILMKTKRIEPLTEETPRQWYFENNQDLIVKASVDNSIIFNFNKNRVYNTWVNDDSPKAFYKDKYLYEENFTYETILSFNNFGKTPFFHGGIIFRTTTGMLYFWGVHCSNTLILSKIGENTTMINRQINSNTVKLEMKRINGAYHFAYSEVPEAIIELFVTKNIDAIHSLGLGCKTWEEASLLSLHFTNIKFKKTDMINE